MPPPSIHSHYPLPNCTTTYKSAKAAGSVHVSSPEQGTQPFPERGTPPELAAGKGDRIPPLEPSITLLVPFFVNGYGLWHAMAIVFFCVYMHNAFTYVLCMYFHYSNLIEDP